MKRVRPKKTNLLEFFSTTFQRKTNRTLSKWKLQTNSSLVLVPTSTYTCSVTKGKAVWILLLFLINIYPNILANQNI